MGHEIFRFLGQKSGIFSGWTQIGLYLRTYLTGSIDKAFGPSRRAKNRKIREVKFFGFFAPRPARAPRGPDFWGPPGLPWGTP